MNKKKNYFIEEKSSPSLGWWQSLSSTITNFKYQTKKTFSQFKQKIFQPEEDLLQKQIFIQGKKYKNRKQAKLVVKNILWFSYRKNISLKNNKNDLKSDVGWGCLARVGQMALASAITKYFESQSQKINFQSFQSYQSQIENLILAFSDTNTDFRAQKYSLNKILQTADQMFQLKVGQWFNISSISACLQKLQNKNPMRGAQGMKVMFFDQSINMKDIYLLENLKPCQCTRKVCVCEKCHSNFQKGSKKITVKNQNGLIQTIILDPKDSKDSYQQQSFMMKKNRSVKESKGLSMDLHYSNINSNQNNLELFRQALFTKDLCLFVLTRVGNPKELESINKAIFRLLDLSFCFGIMTGFPRQAIFVVGREENRLIYLNPHYVQEHDTRDMSRKDSYFCQEYLLCQRTDLDPSMGFCFYIQNIGELQKLSNTINYINQKYSDALSIGIHSGWSDINFKDYQEEEQYDDDNTSNFSQFSSFDV